MDERIGLEKGDEIYGRIDDEGRLSIVAREEVSQLEGNSEFLQTVNGFFDGAELSEEERLDLLSRMKREEIVLDTSELGANGFVYVVDNETGKLGEGILANPQIINDAFDRTEVDPTERSYLTQRIADYGSTLDFNDMDAGFLNVVDRESGDSEGIPVDLEPLVEVEEGVSYVVTQEAIGTREEEPVDVTVYPEVEEVEEPEEDNRNWFRRRWDELFSEEIDPLESIEPAYSVITDNEGHGRLKENVEDLLKRENPHEARKILNRVLSGESYLTVVDKETLREQTNAEFEREFERDVVNAPDSFNVGGDSYAIECVDEVEEVEEDGRSRWRYALPVGIAALAAGLVAYGANKDRINEYLAERFGGDEPTEIVVPTPVVKGYTQAQLDAAVDSTREAVATTYTDSLIGADLAVQAHQRRADEADSALGVAEAKLEDYERDARRNAEDLRKSRESVARFRREAAGYKESWKGAEERVSRYAGSLGALFVGQPDSAEAVERVGAGEAVVLPGSEAQGYDASADTSGQYMFEVGEDGPEGFGRQVGGN